MVRPHPNEEVVVSFESRGDLHRAIHLFWERSSPLYGIPRNVLGKKEYGIEYRHVQSLKQAGLNFTIHTRPCTVGGTLYR